MEARLAPWPELVCVLCGLIVLFDYGGSLGGYPGQCPANAGGPHIEPSSPAADAAQLLHAAWLRDPFTAVDRTK